MFSSLGGTVGGTVGGLAVSQQSSPPQFSAVPPKPPFPDWLPTWLSDNPYFSAGFGLFGLGFAATLCRGMTTRCMRLAEKRLLTTLEIPSKDHSYQWVMQWLVTKSESVKKCSPCMMILLKALSKNSMMKKHQTVYDPSS